MKKFLQSISVILLSYSAFGQMSTFQIFDDNGVDVTGGTYNYAGPNSPSDPYFKYTIDFDIRNNLSLPVTSKVKRIETGTLTGTSHYHCYGICYSSINAGDDYIFPESTDAEYLDYVVIPGGDTSILNTYLKPYTGVGIASFRFVVFDDSNPSDSAFVDIVYDIRAFTGVNENDNVKMALYPNPADHTTILDFSGSTYSNSDMIIEICDMLGKKYMSYSTSVAQGKLNIDTEELTDGIYFVSVRNGREVIKTTRLIVKH
ncbi:T9SS type A sorting domain-containing protein [Flavobacteriales bacterium]|nr:T9SS type A sorting domain-containing protein [Flavobacteriales bacterium]